jgi:DNA-binding transcriptional ArsR family regulator
MLNQMVEYPSDKLDAVYAAVSHPLRRRLVGLIAGSGSTVTALAEPFPVSLAAVSKHIRVLEGAGLIRRTIQGREHHLALEPLALVPAAMWLDSYRAFWEGRLDALENRLGREKTR